MNLSYIKPPLEGDISVVALTADTACAAQQLWTDAKTTKLVNIVADADTWIIIHDSDVAAPVITSASGDSRCWPLKAGVPQPFTVSRPNNYVRAISEEDTYLRWLCEEH